MHLLPIHPYPYPYPYILTHSPTASAHPFYLHTYTGSNTVALFQAGGQLPHPPRRMTFKRKTADFTITLKYDDVSMKSLPQGEDNVIGKYTIKVPPAAAGKVQTTC